MECLEALTMDLLLYGPAPVGLLSLYKAGCIGVIP